MKVLLSQLKKYIPGLNMTTKEIADLYTYTGQMLDKLLEVEYLGQKDHLFDLEVRQNRSDLLGTFGLVKELAASANLEYFLPKVKDYKFFNLPILPIEIRAENNVMRVAAVQINNIKIGQSPEWLSDYLRLFDINSINNLVDLTNYVMLETGIPSHVFDVDLVGTKLIWEMNNCNYESFKTLSNDEFRIGKDVLLISDDRRPLSLSFIGGIEDAVNKDTRNIIVEIGIYNPAVIRNNSRDLKIFTEAQSRLEKILDYRSVDFAISFLVDNILRICGGELAGYYEWTNKNMFRHKDNVMLRMSLARQLIGVDIPNDTIFEILKRLEFTPKYLTNDLIECSIPIGRTDIDCEHDLIEEVARIYGYNKIPSDNLQIRPTTNITPQRLIIMEHIENLLVSSGLDEVRSWVLVNDELNEDLKFYESTKTIKVTNSINDEVPFLRSSIAVSLLNQYSSLKKQGVLNSMIFEVGKIFYSIDKDIFEDYLLGILLGDIIDKQSAFDEAVSLIYKILVTLGIPLSNITLKQLESDDLSDLFHKQSYFVILLRDLVIGRVFLTSKYRLEFDEVVIAELNITKLENFLPDLSFSKAIEIGNRLVSKDYNFLCKNMECLMNKIKDIHKIFNNILFDFELVDSYINPNQNSSYSIKYTVRFFLLEDSQEFDKFVCSLMN